MNLQDLGAIGELVGGIAVIASVIYLAIQIRHGISGYQSSAITEATNHFSKLQMQIAQNEDVLNAWIKAEGRQPMEHLEQRRIIAVINAYFIGFENLFTQCRNGVMPMAVFDARKPVIASFMGFTGIHDWWCGFGRLQFPRDFVEEVDQCVKEYSIKPQPGADRV